MASWRSGYAEDCKSLHPGSIPGEASIPSLRHSMIDFTQARRTMVDSQLRTFDVNDIRLLDAMDDAFRGSFSCSPAARASPISTRNFPSATEPSGASCSRRWCSRRMIQALEIDAGDKVLDVACGRGYSSAILSRARGLR